MNKDDIFKAVDDWTKWANKSEDGCYDIALLKIWIKFEKFLSDIFVQYALGQKSEDGYAPKRKLQFKDESQLNAFLKTNTKYIDYLDKIKSLSKHIFVDDIFQNIIFLDSCNSNVYNEIIAIRNYTVHESKEARDRYIRVCLNGNKPFVEPNIYLKKLRKNGKSPYSIYIESIKSMVILLSNPEL